MMNLNRNSMNQQGLMFVEVNKHQPQFRFAIC